MMSPDEQRGYAKGYSAGKRRAKVGSAREIRDAIREDFIQRMMIAIAPQVIAEPWGKTVNGEFKPETSAQKITLTIRHIAEEAAGQCEFHHAQVIEARRAETHSGSGADESAVPEGCAKDLQP